MATRHRMSEHFTIEEFDSHDGKRVPLHLVRGIELWCEWWGEPLRKAFGPVHVVSGYRSPLHNLAVGGVKNSVHLGRSLLPPLDIVGEVHAAAADVECAKGGVPEWERWALRQREVNAHLAGRGRGGIGSYKFQGFVHLDTWTKRDWDG